MSKVRICFLGTPDFAVTCLKKIFEDDHYEVVGVVTQPDRPAGRKLQLQPSAVKSFCMSHNIRVISPESVNKQIILEEIISWGAEVCVVVAFGQILGDKFLHSFPLGCVNVHASLLPRWRGAAPIQRAIETGDATTGVCLQKIVKELDAGDVIAERKISITENMTALELHNELAILGADLLHVEFMDFVRGNLVAVPQDKSKVTYAKKIEKSESLIDWQKTASEIHNKIRAFTWGPGTYTFYGGKKIKIHKSQIIDEKSSGPVGQVTKVEPDQIHIQCKEGVLALLELQPESRNRMRAADFLKGNPLNPGDYLG